MCQPAEGQRKEVRRQLDFQRPPLRIDLVTDEGKLFLNGQRYFANCEP